MVKTATKKDSSSWKISYWFWKPQLPLISYIERMTSDCLILEL